jgi:hypothetical protein
VANSYAGARPLRTFQHLGETFTVVRWRDQTGKHWRGYTALLHEGVRVADDIGRNKRDADEPWETAFARRVRSREELLAGIASAKNR